MKTKNNEDSFDVSIGQPFIGGAYADITILEHLLSEEQTMYLHKPKKHYQRRKIIQEKLTRFRIDKIVKEADDLPLAGRAPYPLAHQDEKFEEFWDEPDHGKRSKKIRRFEGLDYSDYEKMDDPTERGVEPKEKMGNRKFEVEPAVWDYEPEGKRRLF